MSSVVISGDTSGAITLSAPAVAGTNTLTLPASTGNILSSTSQLVGNGTTTNDNASAGQVGQYISGTGTNVSITSSATNLASISLTAGDWNVSVFASSAGISAGTTGWRIGLGTTSATFGSPGVDFLWSACDTVNGVAGISFSNYRVSIASTTTIYAVMSTIAGTAPTSGVLSARRIR